MTPEAPAAEIHEEIAAELEGGVGVEEHAEEEGTFPPFDPTFFASQLLWLAITFTALYLLMSRVIIPRIGGILEDRRDRIARDLDQAERLKQQSEEAVASYERALAEARSRAQKIAGRGARQGQGRSCRQAGRNRGRPSTASWPRAEARIGDDQGEGPCRCRRDRRPRPPRPWSSGCSAPKPQRRRASAAVAGVRTGSSTMLEDRYLLGLGRPHPVHRHRHLLRACRRWSSGSSTSAPRPSATSSTKPAGCARRPRRSSPSTSARHAKPSTRPRRSSSRPRREADRLRFGRRPRTDEYVARRTKIAEQKIVQAEAQALQEVRGAVRRRCDRRRRADPQGQGAGDLKPSGSLRAPSVK